MPSSKSPLRLSDSVSSRVSRALRKAASRRLSGFTLAELIVVVAILAVLAAIAFLALSGYSSDARDAKAKANVRSVHSAISAESALTGNSPRYYVSHDADYALSWAYLYVDGTPVALTGGNVGEAPLDSNYSAGQPRWDRLKLDPENFRTSGISAGSRIALGFAPFLPESFAAFDRTATLAWAADVPTVSGAGRARSVSFFQTAGILPDSWSAVVFGNFPEPSEADLTASESNGKPAAAGFVRNPDAGPAEALTDSSSVSAPLASCGAIPHGGTKTFWTAESVAFGQSCPAGVEFSCDNGSWTHASVDKAGYPSEVECVVWTPANCSAATVDGYSLSATNHGGAVTGTKPDASFQNGTKTLSQAFDCSNGTFLSDGAETGTVTSCNEGYESNGTACVLKTYTVSGSFGANGSGATVSVCGTNVIAASDGSFSRTGIPHGTVCNDVIAIRTGFDCSTLTNGPSFLISDVTDVLGSCMVSATAIVISSNIKEYNLHSELGAPATPVNVHVTVGTWVYVWSDNTSVPAFSTVWLPSGSMITLVNYGYIMWKGWAWWGYGMPCGYNGCSGGTAVEFTINAAVDSQYGYILGGGWGGWAGIWWLRGGWGGWAGGGSGWTGDAWSVITTPWWAWGALGQPGGSSAAGVCCYGGVYFQWWWWWGRVVPGSNTSATSVPSSASGGGTWGPGGSTRIYVTYALGGGTWLPWMNWSDPWSGNSGWTGWGGGTWGSPWAWGYGSLWWSAGKAVKTHGNSLAWLSGSIPTTVLGGIE